MAVDMSVEAEPLLAEARRAPLLAKLALAGAEPVASSRSTRVIRVTLQDGGAVYVKRYLYPTRRDRLRGMFRGTLFGTDKARKEFENLRRMAQKGWPVPRALEAARRRGRCFLRECTLVTAEIEGPTVRADLFLRRDPPPSRRRRREGIAEAAALVRAMHQGGYTDGSLALRNLLVRDRDGVIEVFKVDCAKGRWRTPPGRRALEDLARRDAGAQAVMSPRDRLRFLRGYLGGRLGHSARLWIEALDSARRKYEVWELPRLLEVFNVP